MIYVFYTNKDTDGVIDGYKSFMLLLFVLTLLYKNDIEIFYMINV